LTPATLHRSVDATAAYLETEDTIGSQKSFSEKLQARDGVEKTKIGDRKTRGYRGIRVIKDVEPRSSRMISRPA
jgi:hypothetical protein